MLYIAVIGLWALVVVMGAFTRSAIYEQTNWTMIIAPEPTLTCPDHNFGDNARSKFWLYTGSTGSWPFEFGIVGGESLLSRAAIRTARN